MPARASRNFPSFFSPLIVVHLLLAVTERLIKASQAVAPATQPSSRFSSNSTRALRHYYASLLRLLLPVMKVSSFLSCLCVELYAYPTKSCTEDTICAPANPLDRLFTLLGKAATGSRTHSGVSDTFLRFDAGTGTRSSDSQASPPQMAKQLSHGVQTKVKTARGPSITPRMLASRDKQVQLSLSRNLDLEHEQVESSQQLSLQAKVAASAALPQLFNRARSIWPFPAAAPTAIKKDTLGPSRAAALVQPGTGQEAAKERKRTAAGSAASVDAALSTALAVGNLEQAKACRF